MFQSNLRPLLERLREEVGNAGSLTHESRQLLRERADEIEVALQTPARPEGVQHVEHNQRLASLVAQFEADHPGLAATMREVMLTLGQVGI